MHCVTINSFKVWKSHIPAFTVHFISLWSIQKDTAWLILNVFFLIIQFLLYTFHSHFLFITHASIPSLLLLFFSSLISQILVTPPLTSSFTPFSFLVMTPNMEHKLLSQLENLESNLLLSFVNCCHLLRECLRKAPLNIPDSTYMLPLHRFVENK